MSTYAKSICLKWNCFCMLKWIVWNRTVLTFKLNPKLRRLLERTKIITFGEIYPYHKFCRILGVRAKNLEATISFVDFSKAVDSIHRGKMEQILLAYGLPKEIVGAIIMLYKNTKVKIPGRRHRLLRHCSRCAARRYIDPIICVDYVLRASIDIMKDNGFKQAKERSRRYPEQTITDADYANNIALLANTPAQADTLLHTLERAAGGIGPHVSADKTEYMCFNQRGVISTLNGTSLKLVDKFVHLPKKQCLINRERHQHTTSKGTDSYR